MSLFTTIANALKSEVAGLYASAVAKVISIEEIAPTAPGVDKHQSVLLALKTKFAPQLIELGSLVDNALDIVIKTAFAEAQLLIPVLFQPIAAPIVEQVEKKVEAAKTSLLSKITGS